MSHCGYCLRRIHGAKRRHLYVFFFLALWPASRLSRTFLHSRSQALDVDSRSCSLIDRRSWSLLADFRRVVIAVLPDACSRLKQPSVDLDESSMPLIHREQPRCCVWLRQQSSPLHLVEPGAPLAASPSCSSADQVLLTRSGATKDPRLNWSSISALPLLTQPLLPSHSINPPHAALTLHSPKTKPLLDEDADYIELLVSCW